MSRKFSMALAIVLLAVIVSFSTFAVTTVKTREKLVDNLYASNALCIKVDNETDEAFFETDNGHIYSIIGVEDWNENDTCIIVFNSMGTLEVTDDEIIKITYTGWVTE